MNGPAVAERLDVVLRVLDHQILGPDDQLLGNVDDIELAGDLPNLRVTGLMVGPAALSQRLPGKLGSWTYAVWRRLHPDQDPTATVVPFGAVTEIGPAISLDEPTSKALAGTFGLEVWLRRHVVSRIPGAQAGDSNDPEDLVGSATAEGVDRDAAAALLAPRPSGRPLSDLLGRPVVDAAGQRLGVLCEVRCSGGPSENRKSLKVTHLHATRHLSGSELGYGADPKQGPAAVGALVRRWQRSDLLIEIGGVKRITEEPVQIELKAGATPVHPHAVSTS